MKLSILICLTALLPGTVWLTGCASIGDQIKDEFSSYAEPKEGELAHIRLIGSRQVKVYPNSTCVNPGAPGSGYPNGWQMYGQRKRDLGMPKLSQTPHHYIEIAARAAQPITAAFSFQTSLFPQKTPWSSGGNVINVNLCNIAYSFVPVAGAHYELVARENRRVCSVDLTQLTPTADGTWQEVHVPGREVGHCGTSPAAAAH
ncbi:hypothetical protein XFHB_12760 [Xylella fastidiosa]|uniref:Secreted protein n=1 Tax=Xylella fastidiosa TaxID=2371 RepID=A0ABC8AGG6_XYLFS|nr:hypothetical protein [Xylella fastidiosa]ALR07572.1 hypothetical protein XFHB_12760 [Xylella fastidiosa]